MTTLAAPPRPILGARAVPAVRPTRRAVLGMAAALPLAVPSHRAAAADPVLRRGLCVHHVLNWPSGRRKPDGYDYDWPPFAGRRNRIADAELAALRRRGFDFLRLTVAPSILIEEAERDGGRVYGSVLDVVERLRAADFTVIVDLHPTTVDPRYEPGALVAGRDTEPWRRYVAMVERLAGRLAPLADRRVLFEPMNEPRLETPADVPRWQPMMEELHAAVRRRATDLAVVVTGADWSSRAALMRLDTAPFRGSEVYYTFHYYDPHVFTHQGNTSEGEQGYLFDLAWPSDPDDARRVLDASLARMAADPRLDDARRRSLGDALRRRLAAYGRGDFDAARIDRDFAEVARWANERGIAPGRILLGEFSASVAAISPERRGDRAAWIRTVRQAAEANGFPWAFWVYKGLGGFRLGAMSFAGDLDDDGLTHDPETVAALGLTPDRHTP